MKFVKSALSVCLIVVLASGLSILTTGYVVNTYIQSVLASFEIKLDGPEPGIGGFVKSLTGMGTAKKTDSGKAADSGQGNSGNPPAGSKEQTVEQEVPENALPVMGQAAGEQDSALNQELVMTPEAMSDLKQNLPDEEKANIFNILMNKLPQEEMQKISAAMEGGLTESEVLELQEIIAGYVDADEYEALMKMLTPGSSAGD
ncbi:hypothetical protein [Paenibacillus sp. MMS20-IR301]|uniref:hypothetical protein n=1 Tax=Paenibacillus sp. MMS20-IR301 TaxID=2895946 RepID=UPI0028E9A85C|nr:hypothetical protein [Paenibacillus sp. MMS20-IR301]WNS42260.1 hypothetical protein LOS79_25255 [Paenibacillus sp. MMS20-IR301]